MSALVSGTRKKTSLKENIHPINEFEPKNRNEKQQSTRFISLLGFNVAHVTFNFYNYSYILLYTYQYIHFGSGNFSYSFSYFNLLVIT